MMKNLFIRFGFLAILLFLMSSCGHKSTTPKRLDIPTGVVSVDTVAHPSEAIQCHVHVEFAYLKGNKYAVANDSLLRMGLLQPDYFAIKYDKLTPQKAIPSFVRQYIKDYIEIAQLIRQREKSKSQLIGELSIKTELRASIDNYVTALSHISINNGNGQLTKYTIVRNFNIKDGHVTTLQEQFGKDYKEKLTKEIIERIADQEDLEKDDLTGIQAKGYFTGIAPYPSDNFILTDDSTVFIYTPGEINQKEVRVAIDN